MTSRSRSASTEGVRGARDTPLRGVPFMGRAGDENMVSLQLYPGYRDVQDV